MVFRAVRRAVGVSLCVVALSPAATLLRYPYLQNLRNDRVTILWTTAENGVAEARYSTDRGLNFGVTASTRRFAPSETGLSTAYFQHQAEITGLSAGTQYFYEVFLEDAPLTPGDDLRFRTAGPGPFNFLVFGDSGQDTRPQRDVAQLMIGELAGARPPSLVLHAGDIAYESGTFEQFQRTYFNYYRDLMKRVPFFTCPGNHEYFTNLAAPYLALHAPPTEGVPAEDRGRYYAFDWGNVHFVSLDSNVPLTRAASGTGPMLQWLEDDLQKTRQTWKVVYFHHTPYPFVQHEDDDQSRLAHNRILPLMDKYYVDLVFSGHEHNYQQTRPLRGDVPQEPGLGSVYVTTGGGGGSLHPVFPRPLQVYAESAYHYVRAEVEGSRITVHAIRSDGVEIDRFSMEPRFVPTGLAPQLSAGGTVNAASFTLPVARGSLVSIFGRNLAPRDSLASSLPLPTQMGGTSVTLNGQRLPLLFLSPLQINAQLPFDVVGAATMRVTTLDGSAQTPVTVSEAAPGIFTASPEPIVVHLNGTLVSTASPARPGETVVAFLTGLGEVDGQISAGQAAPTSPLLRVRAVVQVQIGGAVVNPSFAGLTPGFAGLYQVNFQVPQNAAVGSQPLRVVTRGSSSNEVGLAVR